MFVRVSYDPWLGAVFRDIQQRAFPQPVLECVGDENHMLARRVGQAGLAHMCVLRMDMWRVLQEETSPETGVDEVLPLLVNPWEKPRPVSLTHAANYRGSSGSPWE